jgi:hypothetical protein
MTRWEHGKVGVRPSGATRAGARACRQLLHPISGSPVGSETVMVRLLPYMGTWGDGGMDKWGRGQWERHVSVLALLAVTALDLRAAGRE